MADNKGIQVILDGVDITKYIAYQGLKKSRNDIDSPNAGRTLDGVMHRGRIATKIRWDITTKPILASELSAIESVLMKEVIENASIGSWSGACYSNNTDAEYVHMLKDGTEYWKMVFPLIEV